LNNNIDELLGSQRRVTRKVGDPTIVRRVRNVFRKLCRIGRVIQVNNLQVSVHVNMSQWEEIEQLIMEYNQKR